MDLFISTNWIFTLIAVNTLTLDPHVSFCISVVVFISFIGFTFSSSNAISMKKMCFLYKEESRIL